MSERLRHRYGDYDCNQHPKPVEDTHAATQRFSSSICNLENETHPLFRPTNFPGARYEALRPALQLASLLIDTDCLLDSWHALFFGKKETVYDDDSNHHVVFWRRGTQLSAKDRAKTRIKLQTLSHMIRFFRDKSKAGKTVAGCMPIEGMSLNSIEDHGIFQHFAGRIGYSETIYQCLCDLFDRASRGEDDFCGWSIRKESYRLAITLVHELAHAAAYAEVGDDTQLVFEDSVIAENGFDWENFVFGGIAKKELSDGIGEIDLAPWPCFDIIERYRKKGAPGLWFPGTPEDVQAHFFVWPEYVDQLFTAHFWDVTVAEVGADALKVPKHMGWRLTAKNNDLLAAFEPDVKDANFFDAVPEGWYPDRQFDGNGDTIYPINTDAGIEWEGFGRLMRINCEGIWADDERFGGLNVPSRRKRLRVQLSKVLGGEGQRCGSADGESKAGCGLECCIS